MAIDQSRSERRALGIDHRRGARSVEVLLATDGVNDSAHGYDCVRIENRAIEISAKKQSDIP
jgi:hypothetical protein